MPTSKVMHAGGDGGDGYAVIDLGAAYSDLWITCQMRFSAAALAQWAGSPLGPVLLRLRDPSNSSDVDALFPHHAGLVWGGGWGDFGGALVADTSILVEFHRVAGGTDELYIDSALVGSVGELGGLDCQFIHLGLDGGPGPWPPADDAYFDNFRVGTSRLASDVFSDDFESGDFSAWTSAPIGNAEVIDFDMGGPPPPPPAPYVVFAYDGFNHVTATVHNAEVGVRYSYLCDIGTSQDQVASTSTVVFTDTAAAVGATAGDSFIVGVQDHSDTAPIYGIDVLGVANLQVGTPGGQMPFDATWSYDGDSTVTVTFDADDSVDYFLRGQSLQADAPGYSLPSDMETGAGAPLTMTVVFDEMPVGAFDCQLQLNVAPAFSDGSLSVRRFVGGTPDGEIEDEVDVLTRPDETVTFQANGGVGSMSPQTSSVPAALTANTFTRTLYVFTGWNTSPAGSGTAYGDGDTYPFDASVTLYAQWSATSYVDPGWFADPHEVGAGMVTLPPGDPLQFGLIDYRVVITDKDGNSISLVEQYATSKQFQLRHCRSGGFSFRVPSDEPVVNLVHGDGKPYVNPLDRWVKVWRGKVDPVTGVIDYGERPIWTGIIWQVEDSGDEDQSYSQVQCFDAFKICEKRIVRDPLDGSFNATVEFNDDVDTIIKALIDLTISYAGWCGIATDEAGWSDHPASTLITSYDQAYVAASIAAICDTGFCDFRLIPQDRTDGIFSQASTDDFTQDVSDKVKFAYATGNFGAQSWDRIVDSEEAANSITNFSADKTLVSAQLDPDIAAKDYPVLESCTVLTDIYHQEFLDPLTSQELAERQDPIESLSIQGRPELPPMIFDDYNVGDVVGVASSRSVREAISGKARVWGATIDIDDDSGFERVTELKLSANQVGA